MVGLSIWSHRRRWPKGDNAHVFLADTLDHVGRSLLGGSWTGQEPEEACDPEITEAIAQWYDIQSGGSGNIVVDPSECWNRLCRAMDWIAQKGAEGQLITRGRRVEGGDYFDLPPYVWNFEDLWRTRFATCQFIYEGVATYLFVTRRSLDKQLAQRDRVIGTASAEKAAERWLNSQLAQATRNKPRTEFQDEAMKNIPGLSARGFDRAWRRATEPYPDRRLPGRKPGSNPNKEPKD